MGYTSFNKTINKARRDDTIKAPWKNSENQDYSQKGINMNTQKSNMTRIPSQNIAKIWRRKSVGKQEDCGQTKCVENEQSKYLNMTENLQKEELAIEGYSEHDIADFPKEEVGEPELLMRTIREVEQCEWLF